jgi:cell division septal protein FtsQ
MFLPTKSIFLFNAKKTEEGILSSFSQINNIKIGRDFFNALDIVVAERKASAFFCRQENCFLIDGQGIAFEQSSSTEGLLKISDEQSSDTLGLSGQALAEEDLSKILLINSKLKNDLEINIEEFTISSQDRLIASTEEGWDIYFYLKGDIDWQLTKLKAVLDEKIPVSKRNNLEYIELRFENLAPFKYKNK